MSKKKITRLVVGPISTNCWLYPTGNNEVVIIDPGDEADKIIYTLKKMNLATNYILLTHGHFDHICGVPELALCTKPSKIAIHRLDANCLGPDSYQIHRENLKAVFGSSEFLDAYWSEMPSADILLEDGMQIGPFTVIHTPGHTPGSVSFWDKEEGVLFTGDTLFENGRGRTDLAGGNGEELLTSLEHLFKMDGDISVYPGHEGITTIGKERKRGL